MKKFKVLSLMTAMIILSNTIAFASDDTLDIEKAAIKTIENSANFKKISNGLKTAEQSYREVTGTTSKMKQLLYIPDFYLYNISGMSKYDIIKNLELLPDMVQNKVNQVSNQKETVQSLVRMSAYGSYINLLEAKYRVEAQQKLVNTMEFNYNKSQTKLKAGTISKSEAQLAEISYKKEKLTLQQYQRSLDSASMVLNKLIGQPLSKRYVEYTDDNINPSDTLKPLQDYINSALTARAEVLNDQADIDYKKKDMEYTKIYHPLETDIYYDTTKRDLDAAQNKLDNDKIDIQTDLVSGYRALENKMKDWESAQKQCELAQQAYDNTKKLYDQGMATEYQLMDSDKTLTGAKIQLRVAQLEAWLYQIRMDVASGIGPGNSTLESTLQLLKGGSK